MGAAIFIVLERQIEGLDTFMDGKTLSRDHEDLDVIAQQLGVRPLSDFFSCSHEMIDYFMEDPDDFVDDDGENPLPTPDHSQYPPIQHFPPQEGLHTIQTLLRHPLASHDPNLLTDLQDCERLLTIAAQHNVGFRFDFDI